MLQDLGLAGACPTAPPKVSGTHLATDGVNDSSTCCWNKDHRTKNSGVYAADAVPFCEGRRYEDTMDKLHIELEQTAEQCQILADKLRRKGDNLNKQPEEPEKNEEKVNNSTEMKLRATVAENIRLRQVLKDVTEVNKRWQKYNHERQDYVQRLLTTIQDLQKQVNNVPSSSSLSVGRHLFSKHEQHAPVNYRHSDPSLLDQSGEHAALRQSYESAVKENCRLHKQLEDLRSSIQYHEQQLETTKRENSEQMELLKIQIKAYREDWDAEKREKEAATAKVEQMTEEMGALKKKCRDYEVRLRQIERTCQCSTASLDEGDWVAVRRQLSMSLGQLPNESSKVPLQFNIPRESSPAAMPQVILRGGANGGRVNFSNDSKMMCDGHVSSSPLESLNSPFCNELENVVECPGCKAFFPSSQHVKFLDHFEQCQRTGAA